MSLKKRDRAETQPRLSPDGSPKREPRGSRSSLRRANADQNRLTLSDRRVEVEIFKLHRVISCGDGADAQTSVEEELVGGDVA